MIAVVTKYSSSEVNTSVYYRPKLQDRAAMLKVLLSDKIERTKVIDMAQNKQVELSVGRSYSSQNR